MIMPAMIMSAMIRPSLVAFANPSRLSSVHGVGSLFDTRLSALAGLLPMFADPDETRFYHAFDVVITSRNPLIACLLLHAAAATDAKVAIAMSTGPDPWPYDLGVTDEVGLLVAAQLGLGAIPASVQVMPWVMERLLSSLPRSIPVIDAALSPGHRHPDRECALFLSVDHSMKNVLSAEHASMNDVFYRFMRGRPRIESYKRGRTVIFSKCIALTGRPTDFAHSLVSSDGVSWSQPGVVGFGSSCWDVPTYPDAAKRMLEDLLIPCRGLPLAIRTRL